MKRVRVITTLLFLLLLCGCTSENVKKSFTPPDTPVITYPSIEESETLNGYRKTETPVTVYYANIKSKKYHRPECTYAKKIAEGQVRLEKDKEVLAKDGYLPCLICHP